MIVSYKTNNSVIACHAASILWGKFDLPLGAKIIGTVTRENGSRGAYIELSEGIPIFGYQGVMTALPILVN